MPHSGTPDLAPPDRIHGQAPIVLSRLRREEGSLRSNGVRKVLPKTNRSLLGDRDVSVEHWSAPLACPPLIAAPILPVRFDTPCHTAALVAGRRPLLRNDTLIGTEKVATIREYCRSWSRHCAVEEGFLICESDSRVDSEARPLCVRPLCVSQITTATLRYRTGAWRLG